jgi:hypothetical protein
MNLRFVVTSSEYVNVNSGGTLVGFIYAPTSAVNLDSIVFGSVVGSTVTLNSGSAVHFDQFSACPSPISAPVVTTAAQPPLNGPSDVPAFLSWAYGSQPSQVDSARAAILAVQGNEAIAQAIVNVLTSDFDLGRNLVCIGILGELTTNAGLQYFTNLVNTPLPTTGTFGGFDGVAGVNQTIPLEAVALGMLQARAIDGLALLLNPTADAVILNAITTSQSNQVVAHAVHDYLWVHGAAGRATVAALLPAGSQILLDRIDVVASNGTYSQRLATLLTQHPELVPPPVTP